MDDEVLAVAVETRKLTSVGAVPTCTRRIQFSAGHRVFNHESKCNNLHGHNYVAFFHARTAHLDPLGRVIDFSVLKEKLGTWIDIWWDHGFLFNEEDIELKSLFHTDERVLTLKFFQCPFNPTAEEMARYLLEVVCPSQLRDTSVEVYRVVLWETENCFAEVEL